MKTNATIKFEFFAAQPSTKALLNELKTMSFSSLQSALARIFMFRENSRDDIPELLKHFHEREEIIEEILEFAFCGKFNRTGTEVKRVLFSSLDELSLKLTAMGY